MKITNVGLIFFSLSLILYSVLAAIDTENQLQEEENKKRCNGYCKHCGCMSFYCGEECICECNKLNKIGDDCITAVQNDATKIQVPFEILIQGANANKFLKNIEKYRSKSGTKIIKSQRGKRSTVVIYRPGQMSLANDDENSMSKIHMKIIEAKREIEKRQARTEY